MTRATGAGSAMHLDAVRWRVVPGEKLGRKPHGDLDTSDIPRIRALLRTDKSITEIAYELKVEMQFLRNFIKRRGLCDITARKKFISLQKSLAHEEAKQEARRLKYLREHSTVGEPA